MKEFKKILFLIFGIFFFLLGIAGIILPIIPGIPFFLVSLVFFVKSSKKFIRWMLNNKYIGKHLKTIRRDGISKKVKYSTISVMWTTHIISILFIKIWAVKIFLLSSLIIVTVVLTSIKGKTEKNRKL